MLASLKNSIHSFALQDGPQVSDTVRRVLVPQVAHYISLSHFLELSFGLEHCLIDNRPLHFSYARYFGLGNIVACFHYEAVSPNMVVMPGRQIKYSREAHQLWLEEEAEQLIEVITVNSRCEKTGHTKLGFIRYSNLGSQFMRIHTDRP